MGEAREQGGSGVHVGLGGLFKGIGSLLDLVSRMAEEGKEEYARSGEVEALGGLPGPLSRRFAGEGASDEDRIAFLLRKLEGVPWERRGARFVCAIALTTPAGELTLCRGECPGIIALEPRGEQGFGYDPVFYLPELDKTMAQLPLEEKNQVSHRGKAAQEAKRILERLGRGD